MNKAENAFRELVAFDEIINDASTDPMKSVVDKWFDKHEKFMNEKARSGFKEGVQNLREALDVAIQHHKERKGEGEDETPFPAVSFTIAENEAGKAFIRFTYDMLHRMGDRTQITCRAFLIAAESSFEVFFGQLAEYVYAKNPAALPKDDYSFTLEELASFSSINDAKEILIGRRIENLLRESLDGWDKWLKRTVNIPLSQVLAGWEVTREIFIRRNMLVHTDGKATERYLRELRQAGGDPKNTSIGENLSPDVAYLRSALQRLAALEVLLVFRVVSRVEKGQLDNVAKWLAGKLHFLVQCELWDAARLIADAFDDASCQRDVKLSVKVDGWSARKAVGGLDSIREEVSSWDVSGLEKKFAVTKMLLLDQFPPDKVSEVVNEEMFTRFEIFTEPLFRDLRAMDTFDYAVEDAPDSETDD